MGVFGTPWSGKSDQSLNVQVPLQGICFLQQSDHNWIEKLELKAALKLILNQTLRPYEVYSMDNLLALLDKLIKWIPVYKWGCNVSSEAVVIACQTISTDIN